MKVDLKSVKAKVKKFLEDVPETRDNDELLMLNMWAYHQPDITKVSFLEFAQRFKAGNMINTESIRRSRIALQRKHPELRGKLYKERQQRATVIKEQLKRHF